MQPQCRHCASEWKFSIRERKKREERRKEGKERTKERPGRQAGLPRLPAALTPPPLSLHTPPNASQDTYIGDILLACNPFRPLPLYEGAAQRLYSQGMRSVGPPHIFAVADAAYNTMQNARKDQCCVVRCAWPHCRLPPGPPVRLGPHRLNRLRPLRPPRPSPSASGESGAGKTESAKHIVKQIVYLCQGGGAGVDLERKILQVNPLLEAFGNALTLMNDNSSRFGKYTELLFNSTGHSALPPCALEGQRHASAGPLTRRLSPSLCQLSAPTSPSTSWKSRASSPRYGRSRALQRGASHVAHVP